MENASKALLIAGSILIVILLIGVGMIIMNASDRVTGQASDSAETMAIQTFNGQFSGYLGDKISAAQVRSLISAVNASNASNDTKLKLATETGKDYVKETATGSYAYVASTGLKTNIKYKVEVTNVSAGYYETITISTAS